MHFSNYLSVQWNYYQVITLSGLEMNCTNKKHLNEGSQSDKIHVVTSSFTCSKPICEPALGQWKVKWWGIGLLLWLKASVGEGKLVKSCSTHFPFTSLFLVLLVLEMRPHFLWAPVFTNTPQDKTSFCGDTNLGFGF